jgi:hypothetical protein
VSAERQKERQLFAGLADFRELFVRPSHGIYQKKKEKSINQRIIKFKL